MGNSLRNSTDSRSSSRARRSRAGGRRVSVGKNKPLRPISIRWCSQFPLTAGQLQRKRDEFWETAPAFDGRVEIWSALRVAAEFLEHNDVEMAQAIVDGADIILPTGTLCDCYDQLGARYQLPLYVLSEPSNLLPDESSTDNAASSTPPENSESIGPTGPEETGSATDPARDRRPISTTGAPARSAEDDTQSNEIRCLHLLSCCRIRRSSANPNSSSGRSMPLLWSAMAGRSPAKGDADESHALPPVRPSTVTLKVRLSTGENHQLELASNRVTVLEAKRLLAARTSWPENRQRWFACGHMLPNRARLSDCRIPSDFIVQCIVHTPFEPESQWSKFRSEPGATEQHKLQQPPPPSQDTSLKDEVDAGASCGPGPNPDLDRTSPIISPSDLTTCDAPSPAAVSGS